MLKLPMIFSDHMVLQRGKPVAIWGESDPGKAVRVCLSSAQESIVTTKTLADRSGAWRATLPALQAARGLTLTVSNGSETIALTDVLIGEVWIAGGQSNMEYWLHFDAEKQEITLL